MNIDAPKYNGGSFGDEMWVLNGSGSLGRTLNFSKEPMPDWVDVTPAGDDFDPSGDVLEPGKFVNFILDPNKPNRAYLETEHGIYRTDNRHEDSPRWLLIMPTNLILYTLLEAGELRKTWRERDIN